MGTGGQGVEIRGQYEIRKWGRDFWVEIYGEMALPHLDGGVGFFGGGEEGGEGCVSVKVMGWWVGILNW